MQRWLEPFDVTLIRLVFTVAIDDFLFVRVNRKVFRF